MQPDLRACHTHSFLKAIGVREPAALTGAVDAGCDPAFLESHLAQSHHLLAALKLSTACWLVADETATRRKTESARWWQVPTVAGGGPFEIAVARGQLAQYLDLCADFHFTRIECAQGFTDMPLDPADVVRMAGDRALDVQFELGRKCAPAFGARSVEELIQQGGRWLDAGARELVVKAAKITCGLAERLVESFGIQLVIFEASNKPGQFALLDHFGPQVRLAGVRLKDVLLVETYRRGLHADAFTRENLTSRTAQAET